MSSPAKCAALKLETPYDDGIRVKMEAVERDAAVPAARMDVLPKHVLPKDVRPPRVFVGLKNALPTVEPPKRRGSRSAPQQSRPVTGKLLTSRITSTDSGSIIKTKLLRIKSIAKHLESCKLKACARCSNLVRHIGQAAYDEMVHQVKDASHIITNAERVVAVVDETVKANPDLNFDEAFSKVKRCFGPDKLLLTRPSETKVENMNTLLSNIATNAIKRWLVKVDLEPSGLEFPGFVPW